LGGPVDPTDDNLVAGGAANEADVRLGAKVAPDARAANRFEE
jgi:hypothetical protein